jgi:hypothetical protein
LINDSPAIQKNQLAPRFIRLRIASSSWLSGGGSTGRFSD